RHVFGPENKRAKDEELIVRFLAMYVDGHNYSRPMTKFLNDFSDKMNKADPKRLGELGKIFSDTIKIVDEAIGQRAFRLIRALNAAVFDAVMVGLAARATASPPIHSDKIAIAYDTLLADATFRQACERATADEENVRTRQALASK